ncbi:MAG: HAMP domain-containing sensor histidine kinase [Tissierellaceae bacterium]
MRKSIKTRLVINFMLIIVITVVILETVLINGVKEYYYRNVESLLNSQIQFSIDYYLRYFSSDSLEDIIIDDIDVFWQHTDAQVQLLDSQGRLLTDSLGVINDNSNMTSDIKSAVSGERGTWIGRVNYFDGIVMAISAPIQYEEKEIGIIRFITSLEDTNHVIRAISFLLLLMGLVVIFISGMVSVFLANSIIRPLKEVTRAAEKMASGQLRIRCNIELEDEIGSLANTLNYMAEELIKKEQLKNDFISSVSHELRTPLTSIKGWAVTLKSEDFIENEIVLDGLEIIEKESDRLSSMVEELLDLSRFVSGRINLEKDIFEIKDTIEMIGKQLGPKAKNNGISFDIDISHDLTPMLGDENRIKQVLINLLDNAFKFTQGGGKVLLKAYESDGLMIVEVKDNGIGIGKEDLSRVKEKFYKGKNSKSHSGIGLSISDEIVRLHNGKMEIFSKVNEGTQVIISLPLRGEDI